MPEYTYICPEGHVRIYKETMIFEGERTCHCGEKMWRKPEMPAVNWGGLSPSQGDMAPVVREMVEGADKRREAYTEWKEQL